MPNEDLEDVAHRELLEETGYRGELQYVGFSLICAYSNRVSNCFVATGCYKQQVQKLDPVEFIEVIEMSLSDFRSHVRNGQLSDVGSAYQCLDFLNLL